MDRATYSKGNGNAYLEDWLHFFNSKSSHITAYATSLIRHNYNKEVEKGSCNAKMHCGHNYSTKTQHVLQNVFWIPKCYPLKVFILFQPFNFHFLPGYVFGGEVLRFFHGGDECLTIPPTWSEQAEQK